MQRLESSIRALQVEFARSVQCHGMWDGYSSVDVFRAVHGEFREYLQAFLRGDVDGEHGMQAELLQVACVALKGHILLSQGVEDEQG